MENNELENNNKEVKSNKRKLIIISLLILIILLLSFSGYLYYKGHITKNENTNNQDKININTETDKQENENSIENKEEDKKVELSSEIMQIYNKYINYDIYYGQNPDEEYDGENTMHEILNEDTKNKYMIMAAVNSILKERGIKNINFSTDYDDEGFEIDLDNEKFPTISEKDLKQKIKEMFKIDATFKFNKKYEGNNMTVQYRNNLFEVFNGVNKSVATSKSYFKITDYKKENEYLYIYDDFALLIGEMVQSEIYADNSMSKRLRLCIDDYNEETNKSTCTCNDIKVKNEYCGPNFYDIDSIIQKYKHTFKKDNDGNYYWINTEMIKK